MNSLAACGTQDTAVLSAGPANVSVLHLYKLNLSSGELKRLTSETMVFHPNCTPDGKWVIYSSSSASGGANHIMKVSSDGGTPVEVASGAVFNHYVSPDGNLVVYERLSGEGAKQKREFVIQSIDGSTPVRVLPPIGQLFGWSPDGQALMVVQDTGLAKNLFRLPVGGAGPVQLTLRFRAASGQCGRLVARRQEAGDYASATQYLGRGDAHEFPLSTWTAPGSNSTSKSFFI